MGQSSPVKVILPTEKHLRFVLQSTKGRRMNNTVAIDLKRGPILAGDDPRVTQQALLIKTLVKLILHEMAFDGSGSAETGKGSM
jgi:hypothetical protein